MLHTLKSELEKIEQDFDLSKQVLNDPFSRVLKYKNNHDREVVAFIASALAYGNVKQIIKSVDVALSYLGSSPADKLKQSNGFNWQKEIPDHFKHRFNTANDLRILYTWLGEALRQSGSLGNFFFDTAVLQKAAAYLLEDFIDRITMLPCTPYKIPKSKGVLFFFPRPSQKSSCKRLLLFLRWMAGSGPMALDIWPQMNKENLLIPMDTHVLRISKNLGLTKRKEASWKTSEEVTQSLKKLNPSDPTRYDFALCHLGISKSCPSKRKVIICNSCQINRFCKVYKK